jgi:transcriptional regulator with GAF, ATPase, and Fis domain
MSHDDGQTSQPDGSEWFENSATIEHLESLRDDLAGVRDDLDSGAAVADNAAPPGRIDQILAKGRALGQRQAFESFQVAACSIAACKEPHALVRDILDAAIHSLGAERGILFLGKSDQETMVPVIARNVTGREIDNLESISRTILARGKSGEVQVLRDAATDPDLRNAPSIDLKSIRSVLCAPLFVQGETIGVIYLDAPSTRWNFPDDVGRFLQAFADLSAILLANARVFDETRRELRSLRRRTGATPFDRVITVSKRMRGVLDEATVAAGTDMAVLLIGETGTGKNMLAQAIHDASRRGESELVYYNCAAVPQPLMESIFFGAVRGAYTGAIRANRGLFREADRSSLFLDEISKLEGDLQGKLLRAVDDGVARPVGGEQYTVDTRLISASQPDLIEKLRQGGFLQELYQRVSVLEIAVPPLREHPEDIPALVDHFLLTGTNDQGPRAGVRLTPDALEYLQSLPWPGNVRGVQTAVRRILVFARRPVVGADEVRRLVPRQRDPLASPGEGDVPRTAEPQPFVPLARREREAIRQALEEAEGNVSQAARLLGLHRNTLTRKIQQLDIHTTS